MEHPGPAFVRLGDVVLRQQPRAASCKGNAVNPALTRAGLLHWGHENEIPWDQLQFVVVLGGVGVDHLQSLGEKKHKRVVSGRESLAEWGRSTASL